MRCSGLLEDLRPHPLPLLRQGELPCAELVRRFKGVGNAVLCGVKTFWEGVDVPGQALSLVVIDRLPFEQPDDPVHQARVARMKARGENWFREYVLPQVVLQLKQGGWATARRRRRSRRHGHSGRAPAHERLRQKRAARSASGSPDHAH